MDNSTKAAIAGVAIAVIVVAGILIWGALTIHNTGEMVTIGVESDTKSIEWGKMTPNSTKMVIVNIWGNGTLPITLSMTDTNWNPPEAGDYLALTWNYTGEIIGTDPIPIAITLHADASEPTFSFFSFDIVVKAVDAS